MTAPTTTCLLRPGLLLLLACVLLAPGGSGMAYAASAPRPVTVEAIEFEGLTRTRPATALAHQPLQVGEAVDPGQILEAAARLRSSDLFAAVEVHTRRGSVPGRLIVVYRVEENRVHLRFGAGHEDLSGWYLIPARLHLDNLTGRGESLTLGVRLGYRLAGLTLSLRSPQPAPDSPWWEVRLRSETRDRVYFLGETEVNQRLDGGAADLRLGMPVGTGIEFTALASLEHVEPDSLARVYRDREILGRERGDEVPFEDLPLAIQTDLGPRDYLKLGVALSTDHRRGSGLATSGVRSRVAATTAFSEDGGFSGIDLDVRGFAAMARGVQLGGRLRAGALTEDAPFYERYYLGGLYTVRGYASQSLSPPEGHLNFATLSTELRTLWVGSAEDPVVTGLLFLDAGLGWNGAEAPADDLAVGVGYGWRVRVPWLQQVGLDVGIPLSDSALNESFHVNLSLGWTY